MNTTSTGPDFSELAPEFATRFAAIIAALLGVIARGLLRHPSYTPLIVPLWRRLNRGARVVTTIMTRLAAGKPPSRSRPGRTAEPTVKPRVPAIPFPAQKGWLVRILKHEAAAYRSQLNHLLNEPGMSDLLAAAPTTIRLLNPVFHLLGLPRRAAKRSGEASDPATGTQLCVPKAAAGAPSRTESALSNVPPPPPTPFKNRAPCEHLALRWPWSWTPHADKKTA